MRIKYIDKTKGICIALVVLGHICRIRWKGTIPVILIYAVNVQPFFIISGILIENNREYLKAWKDIISRNCRSLLIPYLFFEMLYNVVYSVLNGRETLRWQIIDTLIFYGREIATWFLPALFFAKLIIVLLLKHRLKRASALSLSGVIFLIGLFGKELFPFASYYQARFLFRVFIGVGFLAIGIMLSRYLDVIISHKHIVYVSILLFGLTTLANGQVSTYKVDIHNPLLYVLSSLFGTILLLQVATRIDAPLLEYWGRNSIVILGTHQLILHVLFRWIGRSYSILVALLIWAGIMAIEIPVIGIINRCFPFVIGKKYKDCVRNTK